MAPPSREGKSWRPQGRGSATTKMYFHPISDVIVAQQRIVGQTAAFILELPPGTVHVVHGQYYVRLMAIGDLTSSAGAEGYTRMTNETPVQDRPQSRRSKRKIALWILLSLILLVFGSLVGFRSWEWVIVPSDAPVIRLSLDTAWHRS